MGPCGGADLEQLPGREEYGGDEDGALDWSAAALQFTVARTTSTITVLRCGRWTTCTCTARDCKVGLFGDFCEARWAWQVR